MLLLRAEGLHSCLQMAWSVYRKTVAEVVSPTDGLILFCGMSIKAAPIKGRRLWVIPDVLGVFRVRL